MFRGSLVCFFIQNVRKSSEAIENRDEGCRLMFFFLFLRIPLIVPRPNIPHRFMSAVILFNPKVHFLLLFFHFLLQRTDVGVGVPSSDLLLWNPLAESEMCEHRHQRKLVIEGRIQERIYCAVIKHLNEDWRVVKNNKKMRLSNDFSIKKGFSSSKKTFHKIKKIMTASDQLCIIDLFLIFHSPPLPPKKYK